jgi:hypothetical protein
MTTEEFQRRWSCYVTQWAAAALDQRELLERDALARGLQAYDETAEPAAENLLEAEVAVIDRSGLFDLTGYRAAEEETFWQHDEPWRQRERERHDLAQSDPVRHYCTLGWQDLVNPSLEFDGWWYWSEHLDPRSDGVNPFLHYVVEGRRSGLTAVPERRRTGEPQSAEDGVRRICLFAGYDRDGLVDEHVLALIRELARFADVYYLADGEMRPGELDKLAPHTKGRWAAKHGAYDFGSYAMLADKLVGWDVIDTYDELMLVNDSSYLLRPLDGLFAKMDTQASDWWGLQLTVERFPGLSNDPEADGLPLEQVREAIPERVFSYATYPHIGSYFLVYRRPVLDDEGFRCRLSSVAPQRVKRQIVLKYEVGLTRYLICTGFRFDTFVDRLYPFHPVYSARAFQLIGAGFPVLKRLLVAVNPFGTPGMNRWKERVLEQAPDAPVDLIERHIERTSDARALARSFARGTKGDGTLSPYAELDRGTKKLQNWWGFVADPTTRRLMGNVRAVFNEVRDDPSIHKIVLTQQHPLDLTGVNVDNHADWTAEGREALARCGYVFVGSGARIDLATRALPRKRTFVHLGAGMPGRTSSSDLPPLDLDDPDVLRGASLVIDDCVPRHDLLLHAEEQLPADLQAELRVVRELLAGRPLVLVLGGAPVEELPVWCERNGFALGVRDLPGSSSWRLANAYDGTSALVLDDAVVPTVEMLLRETRVLVTDSEAARADFAVLGGTAVSSAADLDRAITQPMKLSGSNHRNSWTLVQRIRGAWRWPRWIRGG